MPSVLITSANRGLGFEFARQFAAERWRVFAACRKPDAATELQQLARSSDGRVRPLPIDVTDLASVEAAAAALTGDPIDLLLNSAGIVGAPDQKIGNVDYAA